MRHAFSLRDLGGIRRLAKGTFLLLVAVLTMMLGTPFSSSVAHATGGSEPRFGLQPVLYDPSNPLTKSYFIFDDKPGIVVSSRVRVSNNGTASGSVSLYAVDAATGQNSGAVYLNRDAPRNDVGAWISLGVQHITLDPGQSQVVPFQVTIPRTVRPGQHLGGIVAENLTQQSNTTRPKQSSGTFKINIKNLTIIAVQVNLPGTPVEQLAAAGTQIGGENGYQQLLVGLSNTGTVMLKPSGTLQVTDAQGHVVEHFALKLDTFLPQTAINYPVNITGPALGVGDYQATLNLAYGHGKVLHSTSKFSITRQQLRQIFHSGKTQAPLGLDNEFAGMPLWQLLLVAGAGLVLVWAGGSRIYRRFVVSRPRAKRGNTRKS